MGLAMEVISGRVAAPAGTGAVDAVTNNTGDTTAVRNFNPGASACVVDQWGLPSTADVIVRIRSPRLHDNVNGIQTLQPGTSAQSQWSKYVQENVYAQDTLTVETIKQSAGAGGVDGVSYLIHYSDLPGANARLYRWAEISGRIEHQMGVRVTLTSTGATAGDYDGGAAINSVQDQFKANRDYAILGYTVNDELGTIGIRGPDFGNLRVGGPGSASRLTEVRDFFVRTSEDNGLPCIPVFNAANKGATLVDCTDPRANLPSSVIILCALLRN